MLEQQTQPLHRQCVRQRLVVRRIQALHGVVHRAVRIHLPQQPGRLHRKVEQAGVREAADEVRTFLGEVGLAGYPKTTGRRGIHVYLRLEPRWDSYQVRSAAVAVARELERRRPDLITAAWWKEERGERVFIDYNQNARDRTIASPYSVRPKPGATVSGPLEWEELREVQPEDFTVESMPARFAEIGDRFAEIDDVHHSLDGLLEMYERDESEGEGDMPYPPDYPKMPGEPKRVQPSRAKKGP